VRSLTYEFAREAKEIAPSELNAVAWVSAKSREYVEGQEQPKRADFADKTSLVAAIFNAVYETDLSDESLSKAELIEQLREMPVLLVVDDFDTVLTMTTWWSSSCTTCAPQAAARSTSSFGVSWA